MQPWQMFVLSEFLEYEDSLWVFDGGGTSLDFYLNEYGDFIYLFKFLTAENEILQRVSDPIWSWHRTVQKPFSKIVKLCLYRAFILYIELFRSHPQK